MTWLRGLLIGAIFGIVGFASAAVIPSFTGAQDPSQVQAYLNTLIGYLNNQVTGYLTFQNGTEPGEMQITSSSTAFAQNGTVATSVTSVGTTGAHTTVQEWLIVVNPNGFLRYIPAF